MTSRCGSRNGSDSRSTARTTEKIAVFAPMPRARQIIASAEVSRAFQRERSANRMSWRSESMGARGGRRPVGQIDYAPGLESAWRLTFAEREPQPLHVGRLHTGLRRNRPRSCRVGGELPQRFLLLSPNSGELNQVAVDVVL